MVCVIKILGYTVYMWTTLARYFVKRLARLKWNHIDNNCVWTAGLQVDYFYILIPLFSTLQV